MKNYIVTFTNDAIKYDMERQQEAIKQELSGDDNYFSKINEEISFEQIDREVESAIYHNYDNFVCLAEDEDIDMLQDGLNAEYGNRFNEILVIPEAFGRLNEADISSPQQQTTPQQTTTPQQQINSQTNQAELIFNYLEKTINGKSLLELNRSTNTAIQNLSKGIITNIAKIDQSTATFFGVAYLTIIFLEKINKPYLNYTLVNGKTTYTISKNEPLNKQIYTALRNPTTRIEVFDMSKKFSLTVSKTDTSKNVTTVVLSASGESKVSSATNIHLLVYNLSYPFLKLLVPALQNIASLQSQYKGQQNSDTFIMVTGALPGQQFLHSAETITVASAVPFQGNNLKDNIEALLPDESTFQCGTPTPEHIVQAIQLNLKTMAPNCRQLNVHLPSTLQGLTSIQSTLSAAFPGGVTVEVENTLPVFDANKNVETYRALEELAMNQENNYKKCKSTKGQEVLNQQIKDNQELTKEIQGKNAKDVEKMANKASKDNGALLQEIDSGWPAFIKSLIELTKKFKENPTEENKDKETFKKEKSEFFSILLEPFKKDRDNFKNAWEATGFGAMIDILLKAGKSLVKSKKQDPKTKKLLDDYKNLVLTDAYALIKTNFGGIDNSDKITQNVKDMQKNEILQNVINAENTLESEGVIADTQN